MTSPTGSPEVSKAASALFEHLYAALKDKDGRVRAEDMIVAAATIVGERCIDAAGNYNTRAHSFTPGSRVLSEKVNELLCGPGGDVTLNALAPTSVYGRLRDRLTASGYTVAEFPDLHHVFQYFAAHTGGIAWGTVPLSAPEVNWPRIMPVRFAYESRKNVDGMLSAVPGKADEKLVAVTFALAETLAAVESVIDHRTALLLAFETINGMSKTAPMTEEAFLKLQTPAQG